ncbi:MAG: hypothetical protein J7J42_05405 [Thermoplasmata archaeon]|nr:hypothetical protein [Thermoplasmata archaeon]
MISLKAFLAILLIIIFILDFVSTYYWLDIVANRHPWVCSKEPGAFYYKSFAAWMANWKFRMTSFSCKLPWKPFQRLWLAYSLLVALFLTGTTGLFFLSIWYGYIIAGVLLLFPGLFIEVIFLNMWVEKKVVDLYNSIERAKDKKEMRGLRKNE